MKGKVYHLGNCDTCQRIINELDLPKNFELQNIKTEAITKEQIEEMQALSGSYESLFSRRARKFRSLGLHEMDLKEKDYKKFILEEYTFLKRPVFIIDDSIFIGNTKKTVAAIADVLKTN